jgi:hypothetical protein
VHLSWASCPAGCCVASPHATASHVIVVANIFVVVVLVDNAAGRFAVSFLFTSIAVAIARLPQRRMDFFVIMEGTDFADIPLPNLGAYCNISKG